MEREEKKMCRGGWHKKEHKSEQRWVGELVEVTEERQGRLL